MRVTLENSKTSELAMNAIAKFHPDYVKEVVEAIEKNSYVVVGMKQNPVVKSALKLLTENNISYKYLEYGSYFSMWRERLAIKLWSGWPTFPMVFVNGKLIGGFDQLKVFMKDQRSN